MTVVYKNSMPSYKKGPTEIINYFFKGSIQIMS